MAYKASRMYKKIRQYYTDRQVSKSLNGIQAYGPRSNETYIQSIYDKYNITRFKDKNEFEFVAYRYARSAVTKSKKARKKPTEYPQEYEDRIEKMVQEELDKRWREYKHRDDLIATGQYDKIRIGDYRDKYIQQLKNASVNPELIKIFEEMSLKKFDEIVKEPDAQRDTKSKRRLPAIGFYYPQKGMGDKDYSTPVEEELVELLKEHNIDIPESMLSESYQNERIEAEIREAEIDAEYLQGLSSSDLRKVARRRYRSRGAQLTIGMLPRDVRINVSTRMSSKHGDMAVYYEMYSQEKYYGKTIVRQSKSGNYYIPFVGSTRKGGRNQKFIKGYVEFKRNFGR